MCDTAFVVSSFKKSELRELKIVLSLNTKLDLGFDIISFNIQHHFPKLLCRVLEYLQMFIIFSLYIRCVCTVLQLHHTVKLSPGTHETHLFPMLKFLFSL